MYIIHADGRKSSEIRKLSFTPDRQTERNPVATKPKHLAGELFFPRIVYTLHTRKARTRFTYMLFLMVGYFSGGFV